LSSKRGGPLGGKAVVETSKSTTRRRLDPDARRAQLLEHAISAFAEAGIERAVHADVAKRAEVSTPTVFKYFPTREALVDAVLSEVEAVFDELPKRLPPNTTLTPAEMTHILSRVLSEHCMSQPDLMKVALAWSVAFSSVRERYLAFEDRRLDTLQSIMKGPESSSDGVDRSDARILFAGGILYIRMHFDETTKDARRRYVIRMAEIMDATQTR